MDTAPTLPALEGGCLCGQVRYRATPSHREGYYCHCRMCQLAFGNTRVAWFNLRKSETQWLAPPAWYESSKIARRAFCKHCGTPLAFEFPSSEHMDLSVGSLDEPAALKPVEHTAIESCVAGWHVPDGLPESQLDTNPRLAQRWREAYGDAAPGIDTVRASS